MLEEMQRLQECPALALFLNHYAEPGLADRMLWQPRLMNAEGVAAAEVTSLHGELLAFDWIEMNFGLVSGKEPGGLTACYRVTLAGLRAWKRAQGGFLPMEEEEVVATRRPPRRSKAEKESPAEVVALAAETPPAETPPAEAA